MTLQDAYTLIRFIKGELGPTADAYSICAIGGDEGYEVSMVEKKTGRDSRFTSQQGFKSASSLVVGRNKVQAGPKNPLLHV